MNGTRPIRIFRNFSRETICIHIMETIRKYASLAFGFLFLCWNNLQGQSVSQLTVTPNNPGPNNVIYITSTLTYSGNCAYGVVYTNTAVTGNTVLVMPTYCGYGSTTTCISTDTFSLGPLPQGNYVLQVDYHQGSICPISNFDATIAQASASIQVSISTGIATATDRSGELRLYPNPAKEQVTLQFPLTTKDKSLVRITDLMGHRLLCRPFTSGGEVLELSDLPSGIYLVEIESEGLTLAKQKLAILDK